MNTLPIVCTIIIVCGIMRHMRSTTMPGVDFFTDSDFSAFRSSLDAEMKRLQSKGLGSGHKQAEPLTEELLWKKKKSLEDTALNHC